MNIPGGEGFDPQLADNEDGSFYIYYTPNVPGVFPITVYADEVELATWEVRVLAEGEEAPGMSLEKTPRIGI